jgi:hypothetical protein
LRIAPDRGKQHLHGLIGDGFAGVVSSDRFSALQQPRAGAAAGVLVASAP